MPARCRPPLLQGKSRWQPVRWAELPGFADDALHEAWNAWLKSCERPGPGVRARCARRCGACRSPSAEEQRAWMMQRLQPYRVEPLQGPAEGLLTGYYEPMLEASRVADGHAPACRCTARRRTWPAAGPGTRGRKSTRCPRRAPRCAGARSPSWPIRWMRWCCRSRARGVCASPSPTAARRTGAAGLCRDQRAALPQRRQLAAAAGRASATLPGPASRPGPRRTRSG